MFKAEARVLSGIVGQIAHGRLMDLACGTAAPWMSYYASSCSRITLFDQSERMLAESQAKANRLGVLDRCVFIQGDCFDQEFAPDLYDTVLVGFLLSHLTEAQEPLLFDAVRTLLASSGRVLILDSAWSPGRGESQRQRRAAAEAIKRRNVILRIYKRSCRSRRHLPVARLEGTTSGSTSSTSARPSKRCRVRSTNLAEAAKMALQPSAAGASMAELDEEVHAFINSRERQIGAYLFGRKMFVRVGDARCDSPSDSGHTGVRADLAGGRKSRVLGDAPDGLYGQDAARAEIRGGRCTGTQGRSDPRVGVGGPAPAAHAIRAGLVDEYHLLIAPRSWAAAIPICQARPP